MIIYMYIRSVREDKSDEIFKNKSYHLLVTLIVLTIFIISGAIFNVFRLWFVRFESHPYLFTLRRF